MNYLCDNIKSMIIEDLKLKVIENLNFPNVCITEAVFDDSWDKISLSKLLDKWGRDIKKITIGGLSKFDDKHITQVPNLKELIIYDVNNILDRGFMILKESNVKITKIRSFRF